MTGVEIEVGGAKAPTDTPPRRRAAFLDGPSRGESPPAFVDFLPWPRNVCRRVGTGPWRHYVHEGDGRYRYGGLCADVDHDGPGPGEYVCCCGQPDCDRS